MIELTCFYTRQPIRFREIREVNARTGARQYTQIYACHESEYGQFMLYGVIESEEEVRSLINATRNKTDEITFEIPL